ncbi:hypothetical protein ACKVWC_009212 [Pyricularia oryzae]|nr:hypothetical protein MCOR26_000940 [Pyricularia oryzae]KAI6318913.1 hypothetical protein MCOR30_008812 [Pyricularia oryzae]KAI6365758.1 hypothetical protein MCOR31_006813 [Pyricularia oryzae]KAI6434797.1 hypothetical protein MCOR21_002081 [Pyricularia oryzae]KAI6498506.1 hypothetical protein MCOR18_000154 [Pyricularia oryzae]
MTKGFTGTCLCRKVSLTIKGETIGTNLCHCTNCQKAAGSVFYTGVRYPAENVTYNDPDSVIKTHVDGTGELASGIQRSFCGNCGSLIRISSINYPQFVSVPFGIIDSDEKADFKPTTEFFCDRRVDWVAAVEGSTKFATMPAV